MSDSDLVKELRGIEWGRHGCMTRAAARIEALAARVAKLEEALESIANNTCCEKCQEAALVARAALGEAS